MKRKKWVAILLAMVMVFTMVPATAFAAEAGDNTFIDNGIRYRITGDNTVSVISDIDDFDPFGGHLVGQGQATYTGEITIPSTVEKDNTSYSVTEIGSMAFRNTGITKVTLPATIEKINSIAFDECGSLTAVTFQAGGLKEIGDSAFSNCVNLSTLEIPSTVTAIGSDAFGGCRKLNSLQIPAGVTDNLARALVGNYCYPYLDQVSIADGSPYDIEGGVLYKGTIAELYMGPNKDVTVRNGTTEIADFGLCTGKEGAFSHNTGLKRIVLPNTITSIPARAFHSAVNLEAITLSSNLESIGDFAFYNTGLTSIALPDTVETIGVCAFQGCRHMESIEFPSGLKSFGESAFRDCYELKNVILPEGVTEIPDIAFVGCIALESITLPEGITSIGNYAFDLTESNVNNDPKLKIINIPSTVSSIGENFLGGVKPAGATALVFQGTSLPIFDENAFAGISGGGVNQPTVYYPAGAENVYTAENSALLTKGLVTAPSDSGDSDKEQGYELNLKDLISVTAGKAADIGTMVLPDGAELITTYDKENIAEAAASADNKTITVSGKTKGDVVITAEIRVNGITLVSDSCTVKVNAAYIPHTHSAVKTEAKEATYTEEGNIEYWYCAGCGRYFSDAALTKVIAKADTVIPVKEMVAADYTAVDTAIEKANALNKDNYKDFSAVEAAIAAVVRDKNITQQAEVDAMAKAIEDAIAALETAPQPEPEPAENVTKADVATGTMALNKKIKAIWSGGNLAATWGKVSKADGYEVYAAKCGDSYTKVKTITGNDTLKYTVKKINGKKLNTKTTYKVRVKAYRLINGKKKYVGTSYGIHTVGLKNKIYTNAKSVKAVEKSITLKKGKTQRAAVTITKQTSKKQLLKNSHVAKLRFFSTNSKVAAVTKGGTVKAAGKGTCTVYALAANGVKTTVKVIVK